MPVRCPEYEAGGYPPARDTPSNVVSMHALQAGVEFLHIPGGGRVHFDTALMQDTVVVPFYDSMLGKLIVHANTREEAIRRMEASLCEMVIVGVEPILKNSCADSRKIFQKGNYDTLILDKILKKG